MRRASEGVSSVARGGRHLRRLFERLDPEPVIAALEPLTTPERQQRLQRVLAARLEAVTLVLDAPHDPHNGAAVLRSCDAFGVGNVHVLERHEPFVASGAVAKGTERWVDTFGYPRAAELVAAVRATGHQLVAAHPDGRLAPAELAELDRVALVLGNEHAGIGDDLLAACTERVRVPMRGFVESLNVSVTAAILLCFATANRQGDLSEPRRRQLYARALVHSVPRAMDVLLARGIDIRATDMRSGDNSDDGGLEALG